MIILYNTSCSKSREALQLLDDNKCDVQIRNYLDEPLSETELNGLIAMIGCAAEDLVRKDEPLFRENYADRNFTESEYVKLLEEHPVLLQRPIVINENNAVIGRPPVKVLEFANTIKKKTL